MLQMKKLTVDGVTYAVTDETKLPLPETAAVGQFLKVTEVDEAGRVTKVETAQVPELSKTLLWENASPAAVFEPQTVALELSGYDEIEVEFSDFGAIPTAGVIALSRSNVSNTANSYGTGFCLDVQARRTPCSRAFQVSLTGLRFIHAYYNGTTVNNAYLIPRRIYGISGVATK